MRKQETIDQMIKYRRPLFNEKFPLIVFWSHKAGCTNLTKWFFFQIDLLAKALRHHHSIHVYKDQVYNTQSQYLQKVTNELLHSEKDVIKLVRNPYRRAISSYLTISRYCFSSRPSRTRMYEDWTRIYKMFYNNTPPYKGISFKQFLYYLDKFGADIGIVDGHLARQYINGEEAFVTRYIKLETLNKEIGEIEKKYDLKNSPDSILMPRKPKSPPMTKTGNYAETIFPSENLSNWSLPAFECFYDKETIELCQSIFDKDFEMLGYDKNQLG